ncbi:hypothetical protein DBP15_01855 [Streptomyces sp. CS065A]|nr:hypothetical protein DBP15_01855 [Streptomyces sp. CS065A]
MADSVFRATVFTVTEVERLMKRWAGTGEALGGRCFWAPDGLGVVITSVGNTGRVLIVAKTSGGGGVQVLRDRTSVTQAGCETQMPQRASVG